ncbi:MAG TPA: ATP synthase F1 subunit delta [Ktedonobacterales bacterium]|nr:ATP synthase F1 subunit delta [Ktedonobacterales bacterium]
MLKGAIARRYAEAVMQIATEQHTQDQWRADVRTIGEAFGNRQLAFVLREPKIAAQRKELALRDLLSARVQHDALNLALVLVRDELVEIAPRLALEYERLYNEFKGQAVAQVTTAQPLDDAERAQVVNQLSQRTGKRIILEERVDPAILGGVTARVGDELIDGSVRRRLSLLRQQIIKGGGGFGGPTDGQAAGTPDAGAQSPAAGAEQAAPDGAADGGATGGKPEGSGASGSASDLGTPRPGTAGASGPEGPDGQAGPGNGRHYRRPERRHRGRRR